MPNISETFSRLTRAFGKRTDPAEIDAKLLSRFDKLQSMAHRSGHLPRLFRG